MRMRRRWWEGGFTLVELMVVLVILGLATAAVVLSMPDRGGSLDAEAERFAARAKAARDQAIVRSRPVALTLDAAGYGFAERRDGQWQPGRRQAWAEGTEVRTVGAALGRSVFDSTGLAEPLQLNFTRRHRRVAVAIGADGSIHVAH